MLHADRPGTQKWVHLHAPIPMQQLLPPQLGMQNLQQYMQSLPVNALSVLLMYAVVLL